MELQLKTYFPSFKSSYIQLLLHNKLNKQFCEIKISLFMIPSTTKTLQGLNILFSYIKYG